MKILILLLIGFVSVFGRPCKLSGRVADIEVIENHEYIILEIYNGGGIIHSASCKACAIEKKHELELKKKHIELMKEILKELKK